MRKSQEVRDVTLECAPIREGIAHEHTVLYCAASLLRYTSRVAGSKIGRHVRFALNLAGINLPDPELSHVGTIRLSHFRLPP